MLRTAIDWLVYFAVRLVFCAVQALRIETCHAVCRRLAWLAADLLRMRAAVADENLRFAFPDWPAARRRRVIRAMWEHLFLMACESAHLPRKVHDTNWRDFLSTNNTAVQSRLLLSQRPGVFISGHFGNFEAAGFIFGMYGFETYAVARPLENPVLDRWLNDYRSANRQYILPKQGVARQVAVLLEQGKSLGLLGDQAAGSTGCWIDFFGRPASYHKAIALFSMTSSAPLLVCYSRRRGRPMQFEVGVEGVYDPAASEPSLCRSQDESGVREVAAGGGVREITQWYNDLLEDIIRRQPEQYWWVHRRWKDHRTDAQRKRDERKKRRAAA